MLVCLVSDDQELVRVCRDFVASVPEAVLVVEADEGVVDQYAADAYIWDFRVGARIPLDFVQQHRRKHFFVVHRPDLDAFYKSVRREPAGVMLRPITCVTLNAFIGGARTSETGSKRLLRERDERDELLQALIETNFRMQKYDQERTNFLARTAHDLRAPLSALSGYCSLLAERLSPDDDERRGLLDHMRGCASRVSHMADALLRLSTTGSVESTPRLEENDIRESIEQALHAVKPLMADKSISVSVDLELPPRPVLFDREQIERVLINLLDNASRFTPRGGEIRIKGRTAFRDRRSSAVSVGHQANRRREEIHSPNVLQVDIEDTGPGIPVDDLERIFEEYTSCSAGRDRSGAGLGLAICKLVIKQHRGEIWAANRGSEGATFSFFVPLSGSPGQRPSNEPQQGDLNKKNPIGVSQRYAISEVQPVSG